MSYRRWGIKKPGEYGYFVMSFKRKLDIDETGDSENIGSIEDVSVTDMADDSDVTSDLSDSMQHTYTGQYAYLWLKNGDSGHEYLVECRIRSADSGQEFIGQAVLPVRS
jgi:hypothetical protein